MRWMVCLLMGLQGCASPAVRCDKHLVAINAPAAKDIPGSPVNPGVPTAVPGPGASARR
jgi:hypothetical protein